MRVQNPVLQVEIRSRRSLTINFRRRGNFNGFLAGLTSVLGVVAGSAGGRGGIFSFVKRGSKSSRIAN